MAVSEPLSRQNSRFFRRVTPARFLEQAVRILCFLAAMVSVAATAGILYILISDSIPFFQEVSVGDYLTGTEWVPGFDKYGILPLISGTLLIMAGSAFISIPLGLLSAVYLAEYASPRVRGFVKPALELLAGIPTVVYGFFAVFTITPLLQQIGLPIIFYNALSASIVVGVMTLPLVSSLCEDAISSVPKSLREAAHGLGSTKAEVTWKIVLPAALSGIMASFILALSRAIGETMAVALAAGLSPRLTLNPLDPVQTMTGWIVMASKGELDRNEFAYRAVFAVGLTLFLMTLALNLLAQRIVKRYRKEYA
ncbi:MAG: phosphate ABC transporter permease subunit PstC [Fimbriimonadaceae bacterium]|nr:phosphate ABC transporter permease subunit PstC [Fimbriimonadaceae bacterium]